MKNIWLNSLLLLLAVTFPAAAVAQSSGSLAANKGLPRNSIHFNTGIYVMSSNKAIAPALVSLGYDRMFSNRLSWGLAYNYTKSQTPTPEIVKGPSDNVIHDSFNLAYARITYMQPVVRDYIYFCAGAGIGVGFHDMSATTWTRNFGEEAVKTTAPYDKATLPHLVIDAYWLIRIGNNVDITLSPLAVSPSKLILTPWRGDHSDDLATWSFDCFRVGFGVRF